VNQWLHAKLCVWVSNKSMLSVWYGFLKPCQALDLVFLPVPAVSSTCAMKRNAKAHAALQLSHLSTNVEGKLMREGLKFI